MVVAEAKLEFTGALPFSRLPERPARLLSKPALRSEWDSFERALPAAVNIPYL